MNAWPLTQGAAVAGRAAETSKQSTRLPSGAKLVGRRWRAVAQGSARQGTGGWRTRKECSASWRCMATSGKSLAFA